ncbi:hypothetical protein MGYG_05295 [Nannizzia gypsea CBS 118893]|uniref:Major facilitator superfamily (MFS) profile domain-containing protein n=1 Tax=Arthroderma gypseum (strain ATCC MYA-4604 / CBS 118893) TaxID=535722 RepID=E4UVH0_ARTGP|nr:hypothetical protein MGYG_05295 [Nannizzia gypsea CBS 118893]EFR02297.1 hypothetical protein MGYG_05295 [Nannizzia gypsea CBS 118893]
MASEQRGAIILNELAAKGSPQNDAPYPATAVAANLAQPTECSKGETLHSIPMVLNGSQDNESRYSVFTESQKRAIILSGSFCGLLSYMSSSIFYPAVDQISRDLGVSSSKINLTITVFLITQGIAPTMIAEFSEKAGRRPAYILCFVISIIANLGLGLQNNYFALLFLRILQSAGSCGTLSQGLVGDCIVSAERGKYIAYASVSMILGPSLSPILGGVISQKAGWRWIFWFLLIFSVAVFIPIALFLPETCRKVVDNGSIPPPWVCSNISDWRRFRNRASRGIPVDREKQIELHRNYRLKIPNPISTLTVLSDFESALLLVTLSFAMACYYAILTNISKTLYNLYNFSNVQISLAALSIGGGSILSSFTIGIFLDWNYRRHAKRLNLPLSRDYQMDLSNFPIELSRLQVGLPAMLLGALGAIGYGWTLSSDISVAVPIVFLFIVGYGITATTQVLNVLMSDIHPGQFAVAAAARNICQCLVGAATSAIIEPMSTAMGNGWAYTTLAMLFIFSLTGPWATMRHGMEWRKIKSEKGQ